MPRDPADSGYVDVAARLVEFRTQYPNGSLQPVNLDRPYEVATIGDDTYLVVVAAAYRSPDDPRPGVGMAYEPYPGRTPYTRGSELQNAETSAWGRAIVAALAADTRRGVASADEVRAQHRDAEQPAVPAVDRDTLMATGRTTIAAARTEAQLAQMSATSQRLLEQGRITDEDHAELTGSIEARRRLVAAGGLDEHDERNAQARAKIAKGRR